MGTAETAINRAVAAELESLRSRANLSQEALAQESGIPYRTLRRILGSEVDVKVADMATIITAINLHLERKTTLPALYDRALQTAGGLRAVERELKERAQARRS